MGARPTTIQSRFLFLSSLGLALNQQHHRVRALSATATNIAGARTLGGTDLVVSEACLGTMTFGVQNNQEDASQQINYARSMGVNFIDTAELYPVPLTSPDWKAGVTETILGNYLESIGPSERDELVIATKITGYMPNSAVVAARYAATTLPKDPVDARLDANSVRTACAASLRRLKTDRIDLYQVHWPDRYVPIFGQTLFDPSKKRDDAVSIEETASALRDLIEEGKIRYIGLSNETPLGVCHWVQACEKLGIRDKLASIQNSYSLLDRRFDGDLAEVCDSHNIGLLPWSVLAGGLLSGKYRSSNQTKPVKSSRFVKFPEYMRRWSPVSASEATLAAVDEYSQIAQDAGMTPVELSIAFCRSRPFISKLGSTILGATTMEQLQANLAPFAVDSGASITLDDELLEKINQVHMKCRDPSCSL
jgi:aryl-alcohol dehydrogenase-like predicted oxidoreductase